MLVIGAIEVSANSVRPGCPFWMIVEETRENKKWNDKAKTVIFKSIMRECRLIPALQRYLTGWYINVSAIDSVDRKKSGGNYYS
jgi:hypothetical protein